jgi:hypothetical protein
MFRKLLQGFMFGTGFALAFVIVYTLWMFWALPKYLAQEPGDAGHPAISRDLEITEVPPARPGGRFLGSSAVCVGNPPLHKRSVLAAGGGTIIGKITAGTQPVKGLRTRLGLNGSVMSQWGKTGPDGLYSIVVPFGEYSIDGYEIDWDSANEALPNKIDSPRNHYEADLFEVGPGKNGEGLSLDYMDPMIRLGPQGEVSLSKDVVVTWEPYPGATSYVVQVYESDKPHGIMGWKAIFECAERPRVNESNINLTALGAPLKPDHYYTVEIDALDAAGCTISRTAGYHHGKGFKAVGGQ